MRTHDSTETYSPLLKEVDGAWVERLRFGSLLLTAGLILGEIMPGLFGYLIGSARGNRQVLSWGSWSSTILAEVFLLFGLLRLTSNPYAGELDREIRPLRRSLRSLAVLRLLALVFEEVLSSVWPPHLRVPWQLPSMLLGNAAVLLGLYFIARLGRRLELQTVNRSCTRLAWGYILYILVNWLFWWSVRTRRPDMLAWVPVLIVVGGVVLAWGVVLLWRFRSRLTVMLSGEACASCGYSLHGLPEQRCPECGRAIVVVTRGEQTAKVGAQ